MESLYIIRDGVCATLGEIADAVREKGCIHESMIPEIDALTHTLKSIETTLAMYEGGYSREGHSGRRSYDSDAPMNGGYSERRGRSMQTGRFVSRDSGRFGRQGYSRDDGYDFMQEIKDIMKESSDGATRQRLQELHERLSSQ